MWFPPVTTEQPAGDVLSLDDAKTYLRVETDDQDDEITRAVASAVQHIEAYTGTRLLTQTVELLAGSFDDLRRFQIGPVQSIATLTYLDTSGEEQTLDPDQFKLFGAGLARGIRPAYGVRWPNLQSVEDAIKIIAVVGYGAADDVPEPVMRAVLLMLGDLYVNREDTIAERSVTPSTLPNGIDANLVNFRIYG
jgi:uncharacterized phiE125 gp8 family phage protein